ncbi:MAG: tetratricopeptide repeat protein, partial [Bacteroidota bacterium]
MKALIILLLFPASVFAQTEKARVDSINNHFYEIYSADFKESKKLVLNAIKLAKQNGWKYEEAMAQKNLGIILYLRGEYEPALSAYLKSYELFDSLNNYQGLGQLANEMANYHRKLYGPEAGISYLDSAAKWSSLSHDKRTLGTSYGMRANFYKELGQNDSSSLYYMKSYEIRVEQNDSVGLGYAYLDLADIEFQNGNSETALAYYNRSIQIREAIRDNQGILESIYAVGEFYFKSGDFAEALKAFDECARKSHDFHYPDLELLAAQYVSECHFELNNFRQAFISKSEAESLKDSLFNIDRSRVISEMRTQYETDKKEQQIELQQAQIAKQSAQLRLNLIMILGLIAVVILVIAVALLNRSRTKKQQELLLKAAELKLKEAQIESALSSQERERKRFACDLHDGFGQFISVLNLNLKSLEKGTSNREEVFENSAQVLDQMYRELKTICFNLMPETLIKQGVVNGIKEFADRINTTGKVKIEVDAFGLNERLKDLQEISIYRITQEWVNNILKYSDASKINIQLTKDESEITLLIEDDGIGFDKAVLINGKGNGWKNINSR